MKNNEDKKHELLVSVGIDLTLAATTANVLYEAINDKDNMPDKEKANLALILKRTIYKIMTDFDEIEKIEQI